MHRSLFHCLRYECDSALQITYILTSTDTQDCKVMVIYVSSTRNCWYPDVVREAKKTKRHWEFWTRFRTTVKTWWAIENQEGEISEWEFLGVEHGNQDRRSRLRDKCILRIETQCPGCKSLADSIRNKLRTPLNLILEFRQTGGSILKLSVSSNGHTPAFLQNFNQKVVFLKICFRKIIPT